MVAADGVLNVIAAKFFGDKPLLRSSLSESFAIDNGDGQAGKGVFILLGLQIFPVSSLDIRLHEWLIIICAHHFGRLAAAENGEVLKDQLIDHDFAGLS